MRPSACGAMPYRGLIFARHLRQVNILKARLGIADCANMHPRLGTFGLTVITDHFRKVDIDRRLIFREEFRLFLSGEAL